MIKANAPLMWRVWTPFFVITALPVIAYAALKFGEAGMDVLKSVTTLFCCIIFSDMFLRSLRPLVISLFPGQQRYLDQLKDMRVRLAKELDEVISEYGPKAYDDFEEVGVNIQVEVDMYLLYTADSYLDTRCKCAPVSARWPDASKKSS